MATSIHDVLVCVWALRVRQDKSFALVVSKMAYEIEIEGIAFSKFAPKPVYKPTNPSFRTCKIPTSCGANMYP